MRGIGIRKDKYRICEREEGKRLGIWRGERGKGVRRGEREGGRGGKRGEGWVYGEGKGERGAAGETLAESTCF